MAIVYLIVVLATNAILLGVIAMQLSDILAKIQNLTNTATDIQTALANMPVPTTVDLTPAADALDALQTQLNTIKSSIPTPAP